jgi:hypothetical protein
VFRRSQRLASVAGGNDVGVSSANSGRVRFTIICSIYKNRLDAPRGLDAPERSCVLIRPLDP